jgi:hypothetical protein
MRDSCEHARAKINAKDTTNSLGCRIFPPPFLFHVADPDFDPFSVFQQRRKQAGIGFFNKNALFDECSIGNLPLYVNASSDA